MTLSRLFRNLLPALCMTAAGSATALAGTMRHDRDPALYTTLATNTQYATAGLLEVDVFADGEPAVGSATLIRPDWVMTAAHVVEGGRGVRFTVGGQTYSASRWVSHPKYDGNLLRGFDIALVQLSTPVANVTPATLYKGKREFNKIGTFVGFGRSGNGITGDTTDDRLKRAGTNVIDGFMTRNARDQLKLRQKLRPTDKTFAIDFDHPTNPTINVFGSPGPTDLEFLISRGDSGGPAYMLDDKTGRPVVIGIHSFGEIFDALDDSSYGDVTGHTRVSSFAKWVDKTIDNERKQRKLTFVTPSAPTSGFEIDGFARSISATPAPEPGTAGLLVVVAGGLLARRRRKVGPVPSPAH